MSPDCWSEPEYCHQMSSQRLTWLEATIALGVVCQKIHREVGGLYLLELLIWQLIMSTIAHMNNKIMWTNENTAQQEFCNGVLINSFVSTFTISKVNQTDQRLLKVWLLDNSDYPVHIRDVHIVRAPYQTQLPIAVVSSSSETKSSEEQSVGVGLYKGVLGWEGSHQLVVGFKEQMVIVHESMTL